MRTDKSIWIMSPFNRLFCITFAAFILLLVAASLLMRKKSDAVRRTVLSAACIVTLIGFFVYKYCLSLDSDYNVITANMGGFNWWGELPLQLCNINMILIPVAVLRKSRPLQCFCFFVAPLGAMMALFLPGNGFSGYSLLLPRMLGYYGTHFMIVIEGLAIAAFGLYRPKFRDLPPTMLSLLLVAFCTFLINLLLRWSGLHPKANYFYSMEPEGISLLELFHRWIPVPYLYLLPSFGILIPYMVVITGGFALSDRVRKKKQPEFSAR